MKGVRVVWGKDGLLKQAADNREKKDLGPEMDSQFSTTPDDLLNVLVSFLKLCTWQWLAFLISYFSTENPTMRNHLLRRIHSDTFYSHPKTAFCDRAGVGSTTDHYSIFHYQRKKD